ncbi:hypothetical protein [uncultured Algoriphagus sp.]|uniref:hypothetical protein n=1 Tax=uncultured Algoriphagus sp. TaxID=417365 RepID=UPI0030EC1FEA|tara:strand:- start:10700 stop:11383 length:684 start_codon:yes stop_codon:yes gene_type:complete
MRNILFLLITFLQLVPFISHGQGKEMLIEQIAGKKIERENFDKNGQLLGKQLFIIGELSQAGEMYKVEVVTELYNEKGQLNEKYSTTFQCNPKEFDVLLNVFPFSDPDDEKIKVEVISRDFKQLYDLQSSKSKSLKDIELKMSIESGVLSFFGSKSLVTIKNRNRKTENGKVNITSTAVIEAYIMGIKIKTINYTVEEYLTESYVLLRQKFTEDDGAYFTMSYNGEN